MQRRPIILRRLLIEFHAGGRSICKFATGRESETTRERERERERKRAREKERKREKEKERKREREKERKTEKHTHINTHTYTHTHTHTLATYIRVSLAHILGKMGGDPIVSLRHTFSH